MKTFCLSFAMLFASFVLFAQNSLDAKKFPKTAAPGVLVVRSGFASLMSEEYNLPLWVYHHINKSLIDDLPSQSRPGNYPQDSLFKNIPRSAYGSSGYDHGHLAPAADFKWSPDAYFESFYMTNMTPQHGCFNQKGWCQLETHVRRWASANPSSEFYVVSGPVLTEFIDTLCIANDKMIFVPKYYFKVILEENRNYVNGIGYIV